MNNIQFDLGTLLSTPAQIQNAVKQIPCEMLHPYHNHRFELYSGERLEDMVESIKENGVLSPIIVQPDDNGYEILIGHNRWNASKIAGMDSVPAIIKEGLTEDEAEMYVIESNLIQRGFDNLKISEQAAVIAERHSSMFSQGKRNDIIRELKMLDGTEDSTSSLIGTKLEFGDSKKKIGEEYGLGRTSIARLLRVDKLISELKGQLDSGIFGIYAAVEISYLSETTQLDIAELTDDYSIDMKKAKLLRESADENGNVSNADIIRVLYGKKDSKDKSQTVKISHDVFSRYFSPDMKKKEIAETVEKALEYYFINRKD